MAFTRATWFFSLGRFGWSESLYSTRGTDQDLVTDAFALTALRIKLLPIAANLDYVRISTVDVFRDVLLGDEYINQQHQPGTSAYVHSSYPNTAAQVNLISDERARGRIFMRPVPNGVGSDGDVHTFPANFIVAFNAWTNEVLSGSRRWGVYTLNPTTVENKIKSVSVNAGLVTVQTAEAHGYLAGDKVKLYFVKANGETLTPPVTIATVPLPTQFTFSRNTDPIVTIVSSLKAFAKAPNRTVTRIQSLSIERVVSRKCGRPFGGPVGRARRRT